MTERERRHGRSTLYSGDKLLCVQSLWARAGVALPAWAAPASFSVALACLMHCYEHHRDALGANDIRVLRFVFGH